MLINLCLNVIGKINLEWNSIKEEHPKCYKFYLSLRSVFVNEKTTSISRRKDAYRHGIYKYTCHSCRIGASTTSV